MVDREDIDRQTVIGDSIMGVGGAYEAFLHRQRDSQHTGPADLPQRTLLVSIRAKSGFQEPDLIGLQELTMEQTDLAAYAAKVFELPQGW